MESGEGGLGVEEVEAGQLGRGGAAEEFKHAGEVDGRVGGGLGEGLELSEKGNYRLFAVVQKLRTRKIDSLREFPELFFFSPLLHQIFSRFPLITTSAIGQSSHHSLNIA